MNKHGPNWPTHISDRLHAHAHVSSKLRFGALCLSHFWGMSQAKCSLFKETCISLETSLKDEPSSNSTRQPQVWDPMDMAHGHLARDSKIHTHKKTQIRIEFWPFWDRLNTRIWDVIKDKLPIQNNPTHHSDSPFSSDTSRVSINIAPSVPTNMSPRCHVPPKWSWLFELAGEENNANPH